MKVSTRDIIYTSLAVLFLSGCRRLDTIPYSPAVTPAEFLRSAPWLRVHLGPLDFILSQPTSTVIVYFVGLFAIYAGGRLIQSRGIQRSRLYWGIGLCLTGAGALSAGTSYQALGYEIKCAGRDTCTWTSWYEVIYMLLSVPGMCAFVIAAAYSTTRGHVRDLIIRFAVINAVVYCALLLYGAFEPVQFLVSFDFFVITSLPSLIILLLIFALSYRANQSSMNRSLLTSWLIFTVASGTYYIYMLAGITQMLWLRGIWFSENDVLHAGMICWVYYINSQLSGEVRDLV